MEEGIIFDQEPPKVLDLGTGYSNVHLNIHQVASTDDQGNEVTKFQADVLRIVNPKPVWAEITDEEWNSVINKNL